MRGATVFAILTIGCGTLAFTTLPAAAFGWYRPNEPTIGYYGPGPRWNFAAAYYQSYSHRPYRTAIHRWRCRCR